MLTTTDVPDTRSPTLQGPTLESDHTAPLHPNSNRNPPKRPPRRTEPPLRHPRRTPHRRKKPLPSLQQPRLRYHKPRPHATSTVLVQVQTALRSDQIRQTFRNLVRSRHSWRQQYASESNQQRHPTHPRESPTRTDHKFRSSERGSVEGALGCDKSRLHLGIGTREGVRGDE